MSKTNDKNTVKEFNSFKPSIKSEIYCRLTNNTLLNYKANKPALNIVNYNGVTVGIYMDFKNIDIVMQVLDASFLAYLSKLEKPVQAFFWQNCCDNMVDLIDVDSIELDIEDLLKVDAFDSLLQKFRKKIDAFFVKLDKRGISSGENQQAIYCSILQLEVAVTVFMSKTAGYFNENIKQSDKFDVYEAVLARYERVFDAYRCLLTSDFYLERLHYFSELRQEVFLSDYCASLQAELIELL